MKLWKKILIVVILIVVLFAVHVMRNYIIIKRMENFAKEYASKTNYFAEIHSMGYGNVRVVKSYNKDEKYLTVLKNYSKDTEGISELRLYKNGDEKICTIHSGEDKVVLPEDNIIEGKIEVASLLNRLNTDNVFPTAICSVIKTEECNGVKCYLIELTREWKMWIDKETGLIIREINNLDISDRMYEFDVVKDEDITKPEI